jgi:hypothetical protein
VKRSRVTVVGLMVFVGVVAINLAAVRALSAALQVRVVLIALVLQFALIRLIRSRRCGQAFWAGFVGCGSLAMASCIWAEAHRPRILLSLSVLTGHLVETRGSSMWTIWDGYANFASDCLERLPYAVRLIERSSESIQDAVFPLTLFLPQLLFALAGGLLARWLVGPVARSDRATMIAAEVEDAPHSALAVPKTGKPTPRFP